MYPLRLSGWAPKSKAPFYLFLAFMCWVLKSVCVSGKVEYTCWKEKLAAWLADAWNKQGGCVQLRTGPKSKSGEKGSVLSKNQSSWVRKEKLEREPYRGFASTWNGLTGWWFQKKICCRRAAVEPHFVLNVVFCSVLPFPWAQGFYFSFFLCFLKVLYQWGGFQTLVECGGFFVLFCFPPVWNYFSLRFVLVCGFLPFPRKRGLDWISSWPSAYYSKHTKYPQFFFLFFLLSSN